MGSWDGDKPRLIDRARDGSELRVLPIQRPRGRGRDLRAGLGDRHADGDGQRLAAEGANVAVHGRRELGPAEFGEATSLTAVAEDISRVYGVRTLRVQADLTSQTEVQWVVDEVTAALGPIDVLIHNAGGDIAANGGKADPNDAVFIAEPDWRAILDNNLTSTILVCQAVAKSMIAHAKQGGRIITVSSDAGVLVNAHGSQAMVRLIPLIAIPHTNSTPVSRVA